MIFQIPLPFENSHRFRVLLHYTANVLDEEFLSAFEDWSELENREISAPGFEYAYFRKVGSPSHGFETTSRHSVEGRASATVFEDYVTRAYGLADGSLKHVRVGGVQTKTEQRFEIESNPLAIDRIQSTMQAFLVEPATLTQEEVPVAMRMMQVHLARGAVLATKELAKLIQAIDPKNAEAGAAAQTITTKTPRIVETPVDPHRPNDEAGAVHDRPGNAPTPGAELRIELRTENRLLSDLDPSKIKAKRPWHEINQTLRSVVTITHVDDYEWLLIEWICDACSIDASPLLKHVPANDASPEEAWVSVATMLAAIEKLLACCAAAPEHLTELKLESIGFVAADFVIAYESLAATCKAAKQIGAAEMRIIYGIAR